MNPIFQKIAIEAIKRRRKQTRPGQKISRYEVGKEFFKLRVEATHLLTDAFLISLGVLSAGFGLKGFLLPNNFIDGGVTGISLLVAALSDYSLPVLIVVFNIPFIFLAFTQVGRSFAVKSILSITGLAVALATITYPIVTSDKLLISVFGGFFLGAGIGLSVRGGAVLDGTEVLAIYLSRRTGVTIGDIILVLNVIIFSVAAYLLSVETALYAILTYLAASKTVDFVIEGVEEYTGVTIVSTHSEEIRKMITEKLGRGVTVYSGKRGYGKRGENLFQTDIIFSVITRLEIAKLQTEVDKLDPNAFLVMSSIKDTRGGMIKKRPFKH